MKPNRRHVRVLQRRAEWLRKRIADNKDKDLSYDKAELSATLAAIERLQDGESDNRREVKSRAR